VMVPLVSTGTSTIGTSGTGTRYHTPSVGTGTGGSTGTKAAGLPSRHLLPPGPSPAPRMGQTPRGPHHVPRKCSRVKGCRPHA
jgi:hypothetical protein